VLEEDGAITVLNINGTQNRYEMKQDGHYHFRCEKCGRVFDLDEPIDKDLDEIISRRTGFAVSHHQTEFRGLCKDCQQHLQNNEEREYMSKSVKGSQTEKNY
jgi:Fur family peroxide stress response transcriptional regulator